MRIGTACNNVVALLCETFDQNFGIVQHLNKHADYTGRQKSSDSIIVFEKVNAKCGQLAHGNRTS